MVWLMQLLLSELSLFSVWIYEDHLLSSSVCVILGLFYINCTRRIREQGREGPFLYISVGNYLSQLMCVSLQIWWFASLCRSNCKSPFKWQISNDIKCDLMCWRLRRSISSSTSSSGGDSGCDYKYIYFTIRKCFLRLETIVNERLRLFKSALVHRDSKSAWEEWIDPEEDKCVCSCLFSNCVSPVSGIHSGTNCVWSWKHHTLS